MKNIERIKIILITVGVTLGIEAIGAAVLFGTGAAHISAGSAAAANQKAGLDETNIDVTNPKDTSDVTTASTTETTATTTTTTTVKTGNTSKTTKGNGGNNTNKTTAAGKTTNATSKATTAPTTVPTTKNVDNDGEWVDGWF